MQHYSPQLRSRCRAQLHQGTKPALGVSGLWEWVLLAPMVTCSLKTMDSAREVMLMLSQTRAVRLQEVPPAAFFSPLLNTSLPCAYIF